ncbi:MAG: pyrroloquinoline quinone-dependent dehydrogenase, partial [Gammaproteobacteria bacterium]|nr:pyrroloquinoline quinone-dependent dehydrogenase [Gammaproteobacteria bacterium]
MNRLHGGCVLLLSIGQALAHAAESVDWPAYGGAPGGGHYTAATQIDAGNVGGLEVAWTHRSGDYRDGAIRGVDGFGNEGMPASAFTGTPILVNDTLYYCTPFNRVFALDPSTGAERWVFDPGVDMSDEHLTNCRAVSSWTDPDAADASAHCAHRIVLGTLDGRLIALDGKSGKHCRDFGIDGEVDTTEGLSATENAG